MPGGGGARRAAGSVVSSVVSSSSDRQRPPVERRRPVRDVTPPTQAWLTTPTVALTLPGFWGVLTGSEPRVGSGWWHRARHKVRYAQCLLTTGLIG